MLNSLTKKLTRTGVRRKNDCTEGQVMGGLVGDSDRAQAERCPSRLRLIGQRPVQISVERDTLSKAMDICSTSLETAENDAEEEMSRCIRSGTICLLWDYRWPRKSCVQLWCMHFWSSVCVFRENANWCSSTHLIWWCC